MRLEAEGKRVTIFVNSTDQWHGRPLYSVIVQLCREKGIAGATVLRCEEGYGSSRHLHTTRLLELSSDVPVYIEIVDLTERIEPLLTALGDVLGAALITVDDVHIIRYLLDPTPSE